MLAAIPLSSIDITAALRPYATTMFAEMSALAACIGAVNLGQGFPDADGSPAMLRPVQDVITGGVNQYPSRIGIAGLRQATTAQRQRRGAERDGIGRDSGARCGGRPVGDYRGGV